MKRGTLVGHPITTVFTEHASPVWGPLEAVARVARSRAELPAFHECEFMYMATVCARKHLCIHLYKHIDTRCYLNLDNDGRAYAYRGRAPGPSILAPGVAIGGIERSATRSSSSTCGASISSLGSSAPSRRTHGF